MSSLSSMLGFTPRKSSVDTERASTSPGLLRESLLKGHHSGITANIQNYDYELVEGKSTVIYNVHVHSMKSGQQWRVRRRFSEFRENYLEMKSSYPLSKVASFAFPRRTLLGGDIHADDRKRALESYLNDLLIQSPPPPLVASFLRITPDRYSSPSSPSQVQVEASSPGKTHTTQDGPRSITQEDVVDTPPRPSSSSVSSSASTPRMTMTAAAHDVAVAAAATTTSSTAASTASEDSTSSSSSAKNNPVHSATLHISNSHTVTAVETTNVVAGVGQELAATASRKTTTGSLYSFKIADADDEADEDEPEQVDDALTPEEFCRLAFSGSILCALKSGLILLLGYLRGELVMTQLFRSAVLAVIRSKEDIFLVLKTVIFLGALFTLGHRLIGFSLGVYLRGLLQTPKGGFSMHFGWVSLRLGLDQNEIVISGFVWRNPPKFKLTPFFLKVDRILLNFEIWSLYEALTGKKDHLRVNSLRVEGVEVFMERAKKRRGVEGSDGLNLWAALGADNEKKSEQVQNSVKLGMENAAKNMGEGLAAVSEKMGKGMESVGKGVAGGAKAVGKGFLKYNPVSVLARQFNKEGGTAADTQDAKHQQPMNLEQETREEDDYDDGPFHDTDEDGSHLLSPRTQTERDQESWRDADSSKGTDEKPTKRRSLLSSLSFRGSLDSSKAPVKKPEKASAWGVPFKIEADRFTGRNLTFHVQDFLNKSHSEDKPIVIPLLDMDRRELTVRPRGGGYRQGVWLDEFVWKIVNRLINDLLKTNSLSLIATVAASGVNNAVTGTAELAHVGLTSAEEGLYSYNPKDLFSGVARGIKSVVRRKLRRSPSVESLGVTSLRVRIIALKDLIYPSSGKFVKSMVNVKIQLDKQEAYGIASADQTKFKSKAHSDGGWGEDDGIIEYDDVFELDDLCTLSAELHLRVFESSVIKDSLLGELYLPLREDLSLADTPTYHCGIRNEDVGWYMLYGRQNKKSEDTVVVGKVQLGLTLH